jgi:hypothetical protein
MIRTSASKTVYELNVFATIASQRYCLCQNAGWLGLFPYRISRTPTERRASIVGLSLELRFEPFYYVLQLPDCIARFAASSQRNYYSGRHPHVIAVVRKALDLIVVVL